MHTLLIHQAFASPHDAGGTRHFELAQFCRREGHRFTIVASDLSYLSGKRSVEARRMVTRQDVNGVRVLRAYTYPSLHRSFLWRVVSFLSFMVTSVLAAMKAGPVDVVMGTSPPIFQALSAWLVSRLKARPFLLEIRDLWPEFAIDMGVLRNPLLIRLSRWLERFLYRQAVHLVVNSPAYRDYVVGKGVPEEKVSLIANGVDPAMFDHEGRGEPFRAELNLDGKFVVTYAGALGMANDLPTILNAAGRLRAHPQIHFVIVGDGKDRAGLEAKARDLHLQNVTFTGARPKREIPSILAASDACAATLLDIPMFRTTYPNKVFDYMAAGRPTILGIDGVIRHVVEAAKGGLFVPPGDDEAFADAVLSLEKDRAMADAMGRAARDYVVRHFDRAEQAGKFVALLTSLAGSNPSATK